MCAPKLQTRTGHLVETMFEGLQEQSRLTITNALRRFVDNHEAVKIVDLEKNSEAIKVVKSKLNRRSSRSRSARGRRFEKEKQVRCALSSTLVVSQPMGEPLARNLSCHQLWRRGSGVGKPVLLNREVSVHACPRSFEEVRGSKADEPVLPPLG